MTHWVAVPAPLRLALVVVVVPLVLVLGVTVASAVDAARTDGTVGRNVEVAGIDLEGMEASEVEAVAAQLTQQLTGTEVVVSTGEALLPTTAGALGASVDGPALAEEALGARGGGSLPTRPVRWLTSFFDTVELESAFVVDPSAAGAEVARLNEQLPQPVEPVLVVEAGAAAVQEGTPGQAIDPAEVMAELPLSLSAPAPHVVQVDPVPVPPATDPAALQAVADEANAATTGPLVVRVEDQQVTLETEELRSWLVVDNGPPPRWRLDDGAVLEALRPRFTGLGPPEVRAHFDVVDAKPVIVPASQTVVCCAPDSAERITQALRAGEGEVALDTTVDETDDGVAELEALGIVEEVGSFTTRHACCENRVTNIHRFADLVRGSVIEPGQRFSLNEAVGQRTEAKGFLPAGAIADGVLEPQVGGGVSQFATTFFNAAFFAGLDFVEYQSHSLYFSRYPRGREATISWPKPDLVVENNTPYGVLVWPTYTDTTITVTLYSTKHIEVVDQGTTETRQDQCTRVTTTRQRTWEDGRTDTDTVFAVYRPAEGLDCRGRPTAAASG